MNTITIVLAVLLFALTVAVYAYTFKSLIKARDKTERRLFIFILIGMTIAGFLGVLMSLNAYGIARLPVLNEVSKRMPETYVAPEPIQPPTRGSTQPSSQPTFDDHKARMDKLKKDGF